MHHDCLLRPSFFVRALEQHGTRDFVTYGRGDELHSYSPAALKRVGLWDERYVGTGWSDGDYFMRSVVHLGTRASISDYMHRRLYQPLSEAALNADYLDLGATIGSMRQHRGAPGYSAAEAALYGKSTGGSSRYYGAAARNTQCATRLQHSRRTPPQNGPVTGPSRAHMVHSPLCIPLCLCMFAFHADTPGVMTRFWAHKWKFISLSDCFDVCRTRRPDPSRCGPSSNQVRAGVQGAAPTLLCSERSSNPVWCKALHGGRRLEVDGGNGSGNSSGDRSGAGSSNGSCRYNKTADGSGLGVWNARKRRWSNAAAPRPSLPYQCVYPEFDEFGCQACFTGFCTREEWNRQVVEASRSRTAREAADSKKAASTEWEEA